MSISSMPPHSPIPTSQISRALVLGSTSRYRRELLERLRIPFTVAAPDVDETPDLGESPRDLALRLALAKAKAVAAKHPESVVIGSDQVADLAGQPLGKPGEHARAVQQLRQMRGQTVIFQTALAVVCLATGFEAVDLAAVRVVFRDLSDAEIEAYLQAEKPYDCAGSAKSEGLGIALLESIDNDDPTALVGLPLIRTAQQAPITDVLPSTTLAAAAGLQHWVCENAKTTRAFLKRVSATHPLCAPLVEQQITELPRHVHKKGDHQSGFDAKPLLAAALQGQDMGLISEAGMPAVADPGSSVVRAAHDLGLSVVPLVGPVSLLLALAASGLNGQNFAFVGYLPQDANERGARLKQLESLAHKTGQTQLWIETPYRNAAMLSALLQSLQGVTRLAIASGLTLPSANIQSHSVAQWKKGLKGPDSHTPAVYAIGP
eukprot:gene11319-13165_t